MRSTRRLDVGSAAPADVTPGSVRQRQVVRHVLLIGTNTHSASSVSPSFALCIKTTTHTMILSMRGLPVGQQVSSQR
jgi:hypothetical protein